MKQWYSYCDHRSLMMDISLLPAQQGWKSTVTKRRIKIVVQFPSSWFYSHIMSFAFSFRILSSAFFYLYFSSMFFICIFPPPSAMGHHLVRTLQTDPVEMLQNSWQVQKACWEQCLRKGKKLETKQNKAKDNNMQSGRAHKTWRSRKEVEQCIGDKASVKPIFTFATVRPQVLVHIHSKRLMRVLILKMIQWIPRMSKVKQLLTQNGTKDDKWKKKKGTLHQRRDVKIFNGVWRKNYPYEEYAARGKMIIWSVTKFSWRGKVATEM